MPKENTVLTIDIGGGSLKMAEFVFPPGGAVMLRKFAFRKLEEQEGDNSAFAQAYHEMIEHNHFSAKEVRLSLSGQSSFSRLSKLPALLGNKNAIARIMEYEARQTVPYAMSEVVWDYQLIRHAWSDKHSETQEDGSTIEIAEDHEEYEALFVAVKNDQIVRYTDVIEDSGKKILSVEIAPVALFNAAKGTQLRDDECALILNIGGRGSSLMIADQNRVFIRPIPIGGDTVTQQVAKEFGIGFPEAEDLKHRHGFVALGGAYEEPESEVAATISKIARNVMTRLHGEVNRSINVWRAQHGGHQPGRVLLAGGGSKMLYITDFFYEKLRLPVEYLNTFAAITIEESINKEALQAIAPMFQEMIGLSLRSVTQCPIDISLIPTSIRNQVELNHKKPYFYVSAFSLILCLVIFAFGVNKRLNFDKQRVERVKIEVEKTNVKVKEVDGLAGKLNSAKNAFEEPMQFLAARGKWTEMLAELEQKMPDTMWFASLEGVGDEVASEDGQGGGSSGVGNPFGGSGEPAATGATTSALPINITEVKQLRLTGYTLIMGENLLEERFLKQLKGSKFFEDVEGGSSLVKFTPETDTLNLSSFEILVKLKESIKK
ncbi:MAG: pilus assembly protein PilM [Victivallales bacterium]|nr:pilus assembly protein PilM [Victivallales bacterium]